MAGGSYTPAEPAAVLAARAVLATPFGACGLEGVRHPEPRMHGLLATQVIGLLSRYAGANGPKAGGGAPCARTLVDT